MSARPSFSPAVAPLSVAKQADLNVLPGLPASQLADRAVRWGPAGLAAGAGAAGLVGLIGELRRQKKENLQARQVAGGQADNDTLVVRVPQKVASSKAAGFLPKSTLGRSLFGGAALAAASGAIPAATGALATPTAADHAAVAAQDNHLYETSMRLGIPALAAVGGYGLVDGLINHRKKQDVQAQLDHSKEEYARMLGQTLGDPEAKTAAAYFPALEGLIGAALDQLVPHDDTVRPKHAKTAAGGLLAEITSAPGALGLLSAAVAHKLVYDREREADEIHQVKRFAPPKAIRLETVRQPVQALGLPSAAHGSDPLLDADGVAPGTKEEEPKLAAGLEELAELGGVAMLAGHNKGHGEGDPEGKPTETIPVSPEPTLHHLTPNQAVVDVPGASMDIQAADPGAQALLHHRAARLARLLAAGNVAANGAGGPVEPTE